MSLGSAQADVAAFGCSNTYAPAPAITIDGDLAWTQVCDVPLAATGGGLHLWLGWRPPAFAFAHVAILDGTDKIADIFCQVEIMGVCSLASSMPDATYYYNPFATGDSSNQVFLTGSIPPGTHLVFELAPNAVGACVSAPCPVLNIGVGLFHVYGFSGYSP
jgi:hypothetical protein